MYLQSYELNIVSHHDQFKNKNLKKFNIEGLDYIGVWGNEPFEIVFKNNTHQKVQVRLSIDGTDILTGNPASSETTGQMWACNGYSSLRIKAWPENTKSGAQFVFTSADKSVAVNTHGNIESKNIIAAAIYVEGQPVMYDWFRNYQDLTPVIGTTIPYVYPKNTGPIWYTDLYRKDTPYYTSLNHTYCSGTLSASYNGDSNSLDSTAGVGAGQQVQQHITYTTGLQKPILQQILNVRYMWWSELCQVMDMRRSNIKINEFPDTGTHVMSIGSTPRIDNKNHPKLVLQTVEYSRF